MSKHCLSNPKQENSLKHNLIYPYYAGYSPSFVKDMIEILNLNNNAVILDPWNGSGTTTKVAHSLGFSCYGFDINPVMGIVAKAMNIESSKCTELNHLFEKVIKEFESDQSISVSENDPLKSWFFPSSIEYIRKLEFAIQKISFNSPEYYTSINEKIDINNISNLAAFFYTTMFRMLRALLNVFYSSNPTWIKVPKDNENKINSDRNEIIEIFCEEFRSMIASISDPPIINYLPINKNECEIKVGASENLPLTNESIDAVITSPPYCTRIDYAVSTRPELALLGYSKDDFDWLRRKMIGTTTIQKINYDVLPEWGLSCKNFINMVSNHYSKASYSYYRKIHIQYFNGIFLSLSEIDRLLKIDGKCVIVVQDSYYKEVHNDLANIFIEMATYFKWKLTDRFDFESNQVMSFINKNSKKYRNSSKAIESVLYFTKF